MLSNTTFALDASYVRRAFQMSVELDVKKSIFGCVKYNATVIYNWARKKFVGLQMPSNICDFSKSRSGQEVCVLVNFEKPYFCIKASHPDKTVPGRFWTIEAEILENDGKVLLGVKVSYSTPVSQDVEEDIFSIPIFVRKIYENNGMKDVRRIGHVWEITGENVEQLYDFLQDKNRKLPVVVITQNTDVEEKEGQCLEGYLINGERLASKISMIAHVVFLSGLASNMWNEKVGKKWGVYNGAVRTYFPNVDFEEDTYMQHPLSVSNRILATYYEDENGREYIAGEAFEYVLMNNLRRYNKNVRLQWEKFGHKFYFLANREKMCDKERTIEDAVLLNEMYEEQINQLEEKIKSQEDEIITAMIATENKQKELDEKRQVIYRLNTRVDSLTEKLEALYEGEQNDIPILNDYSQLAEWVEKYFSGKMVLHSRAIRSLKGAIFNDPELVFKALKLLGTTYYQMRMGYVELHEFKKQCTELGIEEAGSIADSSAGELGDTYFVSYHGKRCKLERHLKKGKVRDPQFCMRIYFFWSEEDSQIIIGSLPQHLTISTS